MRRNEISLHRATQTESRKPNLTLIFIFTLYFVIFQATPLDLDSAFCRCEKSSLFRKPFVVLWNSPTEGCHVNFSVKIEFEKFGILTNTNQTWDGEIVTVFYNAQLGLYPYFDDEENANVTYNGGLPQLINIAKHLSKSSKDIVSKIPDPDFKGVAVIDWEGWRPLWETNFGKKIIYQTKSLELVKKENVFKKNGIKDEAKRRFEHAARHLMEETIKLAKQLRPKALWGFYGFPGCHGNITTGYTCRQKNKKWNDKIDWLYRSSTALFPSIYLMEEHIENHKFVAERLTEAFRVSLLTAKKSNNILPVYPYLRPLYLTSSHQFKMLKEDDLENAIGQAADLGCAGLILWGNHHDERTSKSVCARYKNYVNKKLGPYITLLTEELEMCSKDKCSSNGRCIDRSMLASQLANYEPNISRSSCSLVKDRNSTFSIGTSKEKDKKNPSLYGTRSLAKSGEKKVIKNNNNTITQQEGKLEKMSSNASTKAPSGNMLHDDHKNTLLDSTPNKTQHKKVPEPIDHDRDWNKNSILGSRKRGGKVRHKMNKDYLLTPANGRRIKGISWSRRIKNKKSHTRTADVNGKRSSNAVNSTSSRGHNKTDNLPQKMKQEGKRGYSATVLEETAVRIPSVYIILVTVTLGGALLMTIIYVAIYYAVNVHGRSHDHPDYYDSSQEGETENPFSFDAGPWWHENMDKEEKMLLNRDTKR